MRGRDLPATPSSWVRRPAWWARSAGVLAGMLFRVQLIAGREAGGPNAESAALAEVPRRDARKAYK
jgi:hypothetical protein